jgi:hypothetical protein
VEDPSGGMEGLVGRSCPKGSEKDRFHIGSTPIPWAHGPFHEGNRGEKPARAAWRVEV